MFQNPPYCEYLIIGVAERVRFKRLTPYSLAGEMGACSTGSLMMRHYTRYAQGPSEKAG